MGHFISQFKVGKSRLLELEVTGRIPAVVRSERASERASNKCLCAVQFLFPPREMEPPVERTRPPTSVMQSG